MAGLDVVGGGFGVVEHVVRGPHVIPASEQPRDAPARVGRHGGGDDPNPPVPRRVCERGAGEMGVGPSLRFGVGDDQMQGSDADEFEDPEGRPREAPGTGGDRGVGVAAGSRGAQRGRGIRDGEFGAKAEASGVVRADSPRTPTCGPQADAQRWRGGVLRRSP